MPIVCVLVARTSREIGGTDQRCSAVSGLLGCKASQYRERLSAIRFDQKGLFHGHDVHVCDGLTLHIAYLVVPRGETIVCMVQY